MSRPLRVTIADAPPCPWCGAESAVGVCAWSVECPTCLAPPGRACKRASGHESQMHEARVRVADAAPAFGVFGSTLAMRADQPRLFSPDNPAQEALSI